MQRRVISIGNSPLFTFQIFNIFYASVDGDRRLYLLRTSRPIVLQPHRNQNRRHLGLMVPIKLPNLGKAFFIGVTLIPMFSGRR